MTTKVYYCYEMSAQNYKSIFPGYLKYL